MKNFLVPAILILFMASTVSAGPSVRRLRQRVKTLENVTEALLDAATNQDQSLSDVRFRMQIVEQKLAVLTPPDEFDPSGDAPEGIVVEDDNGDFVGVPFMLHANGSFRLLIEMETGEWVMVNARDSETIDPLPGIAWATSDCTGQRYVRTGLPPDEEPIPRFYTTAGVFEDDVEIADPDEEIIEIGPWYYAGSGFGCTDGCCEDFDFPTVHVVPVKVIGDWPFEPPYGLAIQQ